MTNQNHYVVEYFSDSSEDTPSDQLQTFFVEAESKEEAKTFCTDKCGAFINIVACNMTKSSGGSGAKFEGTPVATIIDPVHDVVVVTPLDVTMVDIVSTAVAKVAKEKKVKVVKEAVVKTTKVAKVIEPIMTDVVPVVTAESWHQAALNALQPTQPTQQNVSPAPDVVHVIKEKSAKVPKITNASRLREQVVLAKAEGRDSESVVAWSMENLGQTKGVARGYLKVLWAE